MSSNFYYVKVQVQGESELLALFQRECLRTGGLDFDSIEPMPLELDFEKTNLLETGYNALYGEWREVARQWMLKEDAGKKGYPFPLESREQVLACLSALDRSESYLGPGKRFQDNLAKFGHGSRETWREQHWGSQHSPDGVKVSTEIGAVCIWFVIDKFPIKVMKAMSKKYPQLRFDVSYADDAMRNGRRLNLTNGREGSKEKISKEKLRGFIEEYRTVCMSE